MFGVQWSERLGAKTSQHPMADPVAAAKLIGELPSDSPGNTIAEASAWLESIEAETTFTPAHRLKVVSMIDEAAYPSVESLILTYAGVGYGTPGQAAHWRMLTAYTDRIATAYATLIDGCAEQPAGAVRSPIVICRLMRAVTRSMKVSWMRYLPPDRASWEALIHAYRAAQMGNCTETLVSAYAKEPQRTCALHEFTVAVMLAAAAPESLAPRRVELIHRVASDFRSFFTVDCNRRGEWRHYLVDLDRPGPPARISEQQAGGGALMFFRAEKVLEQLKAIADGARNGDAAIPDQQFGREFGSSEKVRAIEHVLRFWDDKPPARRDPRIPINTGVQVELGVHAIERALVGAQDKRAGHEPIVVLDEAGAQSSAPQTENGPALLNAWTLTDYSTHGVGVRCNRRLDRWLKVGTVIGVRLQRSDKWSVAIVRRLRTNARNETDVGAEIITKSASLVMLEALPGAGTLSMGAGSGASIHSRALMLPEDVQQGARPSLFFEPRTNAPGQTFMLHQGDNVSRIKLHGVVESLDGWERVEFEWLD